ncbi:hypothetical protein bcgnr5401_03330 [Bacillus cereus]|nr:pyruvate dehydrogenase E1 [Bacillus cereus]
MKRKQPIYVATKMNKKMENYGNIRKNHIYIQCGMLALLKFRI